MGYQLLRDQLEIYTRYNVNWAIWTYKDIGLQGVVYAAPDSPWVECIRPILEEESPPRRRPLGRDGRGDPASHGASRRLFAEEFPEAHPFPFGTQREIELLVRNILLAEPCSPSTRSSSGTLAKRRSTS